MDVCPKMWNEYEIHMNSFWIVGIFNKVISSFGINFGFLDFLNTVISSFGIRFEFKFVSHNFHMCSHHVHIFGDLVFCLCSIPE